eukprot:gene36041-46832_t
MSSYFTWTEAKKHEFMCLVQKENGHMKTNVSFKDKWEKILSLLKAKPGFIDISIQSTALKNTYLRFKETVLKECGISEEGANLSGLPEEASEYVKLVVCMAKQEFTRAQTSKSDVKKKKKFMKGLLTHEVNALTNQGASFNLDDDDGENEGHVEVVEGSLPSDLSPDSNVSASSSSGDSRKNSSSSSRSGGKTFMDKFADSMAQLTEEDPEERALHKRKLDMELRHKEQEFLDRQEERKRRLELDAKSLALQERQLALMEAMLQQRNN